MRLNGKSVPCGSAVRCKLRVNSLWSIWYCVLVLGFEIYLVTHNIYRFTIYKSLSWSLDARPDLDLNIYIALIGAAIVVMPFFLIASIFKIGNFANDGNKIGKEEIEFWREPQHIHHCSKLRVIWQYCGPTAPLLHIISAFCILLPTIMMQAKLIKHGFLPTDQVWKTDLDFIFTNEDGILVMSDIHENTRSSMVALSATHKIPPLVKQTSNEIVFGVSPEFLNYIMALVLYAIRYPAIFWYTNRVFGLLFSLYLMLNLMQTVLGFVGFAILYRIKVYGAEALLPRYGPFLLSPIFVLSLYVLGSTIVFMSCFVVCYFGYNRYQHILNKKKEKHQIFTKKKPFLQGYFPHVVAVITCTLTTLCHGPLIHDYTMVYRNSLDHAILACIISTIMHIFVWILLWLVLTVKYKWAFRIETPGKENVSLLRADLSPAIPEATMVIQSCGQTYTLTEVMTKRAILNIVRKSAECKPPQLKDQEEVYWLKPRSPIGDHDKTSKSEKTRLLKAPRKSPNSKPKVTFEEPLLDTTCHRKRSPKLQGKLKKGNLRLDALSDSDSPSELDLTELPVVQEDPNENSGSEDVTIPKQTASIIESVLDDLDTEPKQLLNSPTHQINVPVTVHHEALLGVKLIRATTPIVLAPSLNQPTVITTSFVEHPGKRSASVSDLNKNNILRTTTWKSLSLQRAATPQEFAANSVQARMSPPTSINKKLLPSKQDSLFVFEPHETTVVINRSKMKHINGRVLDSGLNDPFSRSTNMRMTSFTDQPDFVDQPPSLGEPTAAEKKDIRASPKGSDNGVERRDSANYSLTSSGDSDNNMSNNIS